MGFSLTPDDLLSRLIRINQIDGQFNNLIGQNDHSSLNTRTIADSINFIDEYDDNGGLLDSVWNLGKDAVGFLFSFAKGIAFSAIAIVSWLKVGFDALINFDFNISKEAVAAQLRALRIQTASAWGGYIGELFGTQAAIAVAYGLSVLVGAGVAFFCPAVAPFVTMALIRMVMLETAKERLPELAATLGNCLQQTTRLLVAYGFIASYVSLREFVKSLFPDNPQIQNWGKGKRWTIRSSFEEWIEDLTGADWFDAALEEASEEFYDAFWETGFVYAENFDRAIYEAQLMRDNVLGTEIPQVTIDLDKDGEETVVLPKQRSIIAQQQVIAEINQFRRLRNRDVGQVVGERLRDNVSKVKSPLTLMLQWAYFDKTPFYRGDINYLRQCSIPGIKVSKLDWEVIKTAMGGNNGYNWGRFKARAGLITDTGDKATEAICWGATAEEAEERLRALLTLSDYQIGSFSVTEELKEGRKANGKALCKETARIYPAYMTLINSQKVINEEDGRSTLTGVYKHKRNRIEMYLSSKPSDFETIINNILFTPGSTP